MSEAESAQKLQSQLTGISNKEQRATIQNEFATTIQKNRSSVSYSSIKSNMDLNYYIIGQSLKEDIVFVLTADVCIFLLQLYLFWFTGCTGRR